MIMQRNEDVAIYWDYENCHNAPSNASGYYIADNIRAAAHAFGSIRSFKAYLAISDFSCPPSLRSEYHAAGVSLIDCPHNGQNSTSEKTMSVDMVAHTMDYPAPSTVVLVSGNRDFAHAVSVLRLRRYRVVVISPPGTHISLTSRASVCVDWNLGVLGLPPKASDAPLPRPSTKDRHSRTGRQPEPHHGARHTSGLGAGGTAERGAGTLYEPDSSAISELFKKHHYTEANPFEGVRAALMPGPPGDGAVPVYTPEFVPVNHPSQTFGPPHPVPYAAAAVPSSELVELMGRPTPPIATTPSMTSLPQRADRTSPTPLPTAPETSPSPPVMQEHLASVPVLDHSYTRSPSPAAPAMPLNSSVTRPVSPASEQQAPVQEVLRNSAARPLPPNYTQPAAQPLSPENAQQPQPPSPGQLAAQPPSPGDAQQPQPPSFAQPAVRPPSPAFALWPRLPFSDRIVQPRSPPLPTTPPPAPEPPAAAQEASRSLVSPPSSPPNSSRPAAQPLSPVARSPSPVPRPLSPATEPQPPSPGPELGPAPAQLQPPYSSQPLPPDPAPSDASPMPTEAPPQVPEQTVPPQFVALVRALKGKGPVPLKRLRIMSRGSYAAAGFTDTLAYISAAEAAQVVIRAGAAGGIAKFSLHPDWADVPC